MDPGLPPSLEPWGADEAGPRAPGVLRLRARRHGRHELGPLVVTLRDEAGLFEHAIPFPAPAEVHVLVAQGRLEAARLAARRPRIDAGRRDLVGRSVREFELEGAREYQGGDRLRDIDWKRSARMDELMTKTFERELESTLLLVVDASRTMRRASAGGRSRLTKASQIGSELAEMAMRQGQTVGALVVDEARVLDEVPPTSAPAGVRALAARLAAAPPPLDLPEAPGPAFFGSRREPDPFLDRLASLHPRTHLGGRAFRRVAERVAAAHPPAGLLVILLTDLESDPRSVAEAVGALRAARHAVVCCVVGEELPKVAPERLLAEAERAYLVDAARRAAQLRITQAGAKVVHLTPATELADLLERITRLHRPRAGRPTSS